jgi:RHS repeat-associated protein
LINTIIDGFGAKTSITYLPMTNNNIYTKGTGASYPIIDYSSSSQLVSQVTYTNGIGGTSATTYQYNGAKVHRQGKGFLGFSKVTVTDGPSSIFSENNYTFDETYYYPQLTTSYTKRGSVTLSTTVNSWNELSFGNKRIYPYVYLSTATNNLTSFNTTTTTSTPDSYGNITSQSIAYSSGPTYSKTIVYDNDVTNWLVARPCSTTTTMSQTGDANIVQLITTTYDAGKVKPDIITWFDGTTQKKRLNYDYNTNGTLSALHELSTNLGEKHSYFTYDVTNGINLIKKKYPDGSRDTITYYAGGLVNTVTDYWGNVTNYSYDNFGNVSSVTKTGGIGISSNVLAWVTSPTNARYSVTQTMTDGSSTVVYYDILGREIRRGIKNFDATIACTQTEYNPKGQAWRVSEPFLSTGTPSLWNTAIADVYGRDSIITPSVGAPSTYNYPIAYPGRTNRTTNGRTFTTNVSNVLGWVSSRVDPGGTINYLYKADGNVKQIMAPGSVITKMSYDIFGNQLTLRDTCAGVSTYSYYGAGELRTQANPLGTTNYYYKTDGRDSCFNIGTDIYNFSYGTNKQVSTVTSPGNVTRSYTYYTNGKVNEISETIEAYQTNKVKFVYDRFGRDSIKTYTNSNNVTQTEKYLYNSYGYLDQVLFNGAVVYDVSTMDVRGNITTATIAGNSATWGYNTTGQLISSSAYYTQNYTYTPNTTTGNLTSRSRIGQSGQATLSESFTYDTSDRLLTQSGVPTLTITYDTDGKGNILTKSDAGTLVYDNGKPYQVAHVTSYNTTNFSATPQAITYTKFGKVSTISQGTDSVSFKYNADKERIKMVTLQNKVITRTKYYFGGSYEKVVEGGVTTEYIWIGGSPYTAVAVAKIVNGGTPVVYAIFRDNLGTITHLKSSSETLEYSFDAYGRRRDKDTWSYTIDDTNALFADRGFTGHEHLTQFGLINMNGRLYDPVVGRFLSPDNYVQDPGFTQSYNRYGYCLNNPLRYTDPSGEILLGLLLFTDVGYDIQKFLFPVAIHFEIPFGSENKHIGYDISFGVPQLFPISYRQHGGHYYYWRDYDNSYSGWETRSGSEWSMFSSRFSYSCTFYDRQIDRFDQYRDLIRLGNPLFNWQIENDASGHEYFPFPWMPDHTSSDKFLTGQVKLRLGMAELGLTLFTGDPGPNRASRNFDPETGEYLKGMNGEDPDEFRAGILYIGFGPIKLGINSEGIRDNTQNWLHRNVTHDPTFRTLPRRPRFFWEIF